MRFHGFCLVIFCLALFAFSATGQAQEVFEDPEGKFVISLPAGWLAVVNQDSLGRKDVNIIFKVRENGSLKVRRVDDADGQLAIMDFAKKDEEQSVRFQMGYDKLALETFLLGGGRTGGLLSYDYKNAAGQPFTGRNYYLKADDKTIYILRFTGRKNILGTLRNQTDSIARSFKPK